MKARIEKLPCPFCGSAVIVYEKLMTQISGGIQIVMFKCTNRKCGATVSFDNIECNRDNTKAREYFKMRYLGQLR